MDGPALQAAFTQSWPRFEGKCYCWNLGSESYCAVQLDRCVAGIPRVQVSNTPLFKCFRTQPECDEYSDHDIWLQAGHKGALRCLHGRMASIGE